MVTAGRHKQASGVGIGAVDEDLIVEPVRVWGVGNIDEPQRFEAAVEGPSADSGIAGDGGQ